MDAAETAAVRATDLEAVALAGSRGSGSGQGVPACPEGDGKSDELLPHVRNLLEKDAADDLAPGSSIEKCR
jgi:hypothetical protein